MTDIVPSVADAEAEVEKAAADLVAAEAAQPPVLPTSEQPAPSEQSALVRLATSIPWHVFQPGPGLPTVTFDGIDVSETLAEQILAAASVEHVELRKV